MLNINMQEKKSTSASPDYLGHGAFADKPQLKWKKWIPVIIAACLSIVAIIKYDWIVSSVTTLRDHMGDNFELFVLAGFVAQMIDGALGMAYGVSASTFLLSFGVPPAAASASIHTSEIFTSGASGLMHLKFQNVNKKLVKTLLLPGVIGAALGALTLSYLDQYNSILKPLIAVYTLYLGVRIILKAFGKKKKKIKTRDIPKLASFGGFMDSIGGGGWGPIVSSTLIAGGRHPRYTIGSVNLTEFFVALASAITFFSIIGISHWNVIAGLILGGVVAAPIAAFASKKLPMKPMMIAVGILVILISIRIIYMSVR
jgi:uncharacterized membrane protein YfcA